MRSTLTRAYTRFLEERYGLTALLNLHNHKLYEVRLQKGILQTWDQGEQKHDVLNDFDIMYIYYNSENLQNKHITTKTTTKTSTPPWFATAWLSGRLN